MQLEVLPVSSWAGAVAGEIHSRLQIPGRRLCLATGATPVPVYEQLDPSALASATVFLLDEFGGLAPGHPARCESMLRTALLDRVPAERFHYPDVDAADVESEVGRYRHLVASGGLDLVILGLGRNGHLGLNEPGSTPGLETRVVQLTPSTREGARAYGADPPPAWGIAVGMAELLEAREVWLLVTGAHKAEVLERALNGPVTSELPASFLQEHVSVTVWADREGASLL